MTYREFKQSTIEAENRKEGDLTGYNCPLCKNKGWIYYLGEGDDDNEYAKECECMKIRAAQACAKWSGLGEALKLYTFARYTHEEPWQALIYNKAKKFVDDTNSHCFYIGGAVGCGKSHICTAMVREFIKQGKDVRYIVWYDTVTRLKQTVVSDPASYNREMNDLKNATVLFIDDFFKLTPTTADKDKAIQILNYRYNVARATKNKRFITIISSEKTIAELTAIDEAMASRIYELATEDYIIEVKRDESRNMRYKNEV